MASYYFRNTGSTAWNLASNWSLTDGGLATGLVPTSLDGAFFSNNSGNCVLNAASLVCKTLDFTKGTGYANIFTITNGVTVSGNVTLSSSMTITGTGTLGINANATLTSNGKTWSGSLISRLGASSLLTFADSWTFNGAVDVSSSTTGLINSGGNVIYVGTNLTFNYAGAQAYGNAIFQMTGTGTLYSSIQGGEIRYAGTITTSAAGANNTTHTYVSGTVNASGGITVIGGNATFNNWGTTSGWGSITVNAGIISTITFGGANPNCTFTTATVLSNTTWVTTGTLTIGTYNTNISNPTTLKFNPSGTYVITTVFNIPLGAASGHFAVSSTSVGTKATLTLKQGANQNLSYVNFTDIDASAGKTLCTFNGTISNCNNVRLLPTDVQTISY
ncbi:MAG: hypothetical protein WCP65_02895 [Bacteroidota bacterium]